jgi:hypothetical protein
MYYRRKGRLAGEINLLISYIVAYSLVKDVFK